MSDVLKGQFGRLAPEFQDVLNDPVLGEYLRQTTDPEGLCLDSGLSDLDEAYDDKQMIRYMGALHRITPEQAELIFDISQLDAGLRQMTRPYTTIATKRVRRQRTYAY